MKQPEKNYVGDVQLSIADIKRAKSYLPIMQKTALAQALAPMCIQKVRMFAPVPGEEKATPVPDRYQEDVLRKSLCMGFVLAYYYLEMPEIREQYTGDSSPMLSANDYDRYGNIIQQLQRMKMSKYPMREERDDFRDKVYDLLADYKDMEKRLNAEIRNRIDAMNDICSRVTSMLAISVKPEDLVKSMTTESVMGKFMEDPE